MSASESSPLSSDLHQSIEQLIAETVRRSQNGHEAEVQRLKAALLVASEEIETARSAMDRALSTLHTALETGETATVTAVSPAESAGNDEVQVSPESPTIVSETTEAAATEAGSDVGPHTLDLIAHDVTIGIATGLQSMLRAQPEVNTAQTREFVNGELRLNLDMRSELNHAALQEWIGTHGGRVATRTASVLELRFGD